MLTLVSIEIDVKCGVVKDFCQRFGDMTDRGPLVNHS